MASEKWRERVPRTVNRVKFCYASRVHSARKGPLGLTRRWPESVPRTVSLLSAEQIPVGLLMTGVQCGQLSQNAGAEGEGWRGWWPEGQVFCVAAPHPHSTGLSLLPLPGFGLVRLRLELLFM